MITIYLSVLLAIHVIPTESVKSTLYKDEFDLNLFENLKDFKKVMSHYKDAKNLPETYDENETLGKERKLLSLSRKTRDTAATCGQLIESRGYKPKIHHNITTEDGYILTTYSLSNSSFDGVKKEPFVLLPIFFGSCSNFLVNSDGKEGSLAYYLADRGFEVILPNFRGSSYSRQHFDYNASQNHEFYDFDISDIATKDIPAIIKHIQEDSGHEQLNVVAYSMSSTALLIKLSLDPSFSKNFKLIYLLGPIGYFGSPRGIFGAFPRDPLTIGLLGHLRMPFPPAVYQVDGQIAGGFCTFEATEPICLELYNNLQGHDTYEVDINRLNVYISQVDTSSAKLSAHFLQFMNTDHIEPFNYGRAKNLRVYGTEYPQAYRLSAIDPYNIVLISSLNDFVAIPENVQKLRNTFSITSRRPLVDYVVPNPLFGHFDLIYARETDRYINYVIYDIYERYVNGESVAEYDNADQFATGQTNTQTSSSASSQTSAQASDQAISSSSSRSQTSSEAQSQA